MALSLSLSMLGDMILFPSSTTDFLILIFLLDIAALLADGFLPLLVDRLLPKSGLAPCAKYDMAALGNS